MDDKFRQTEGFSEKTAQGERIVLRLAAKTENLRVINQHIETLDVPSPVVFRLRLAAEETFVNICSYAYQNGEGEVAVIIETDEKQARLTFIDSGRSFNPTEDVLNIEDYDHENSVGGLGRFLTVNICDSVSYENKDGKNILSVTININL